MDLLQSVAIAGFVIIALTGTLVYLKRRGWIHWNGGTGQVVGRAKPRRLESLERISLTAQHALHLVRLDDRLVLVASAPTGCSILGPIDLKGTQ